MGSMLETLKNSAFIIFGIGFAATGFADNIQGEWFAVNNDAEIQSVLFTPAAEDSWYTAEASIDGACWQCDGNLRNVYALPMKAYAVLPVATSDKTSEYVEFVLDGDTLTATITYSEEPEVCRPPFNCRWVVVDEKTVVLTR